MPVFKQKCVFVIHDVEDKLILWKKKKKSLVSEVPSKPRLFSKETVYGNLMAEARLQLCVTLGHHPGSSSGRLLQTQLTPGHHGCFLWVSQSVTVFNYAPSIAQQLR